MYRFLQVLPKQKASEQDLPDPSSSADPREIIAVNAVVIDTVKNSASSNKKRNKYSNYDDECRTKIARYAIQHGNASAVRKFSPQLEKPLNESTVRTWRNLLLNKETLKKSSVDLLEKEKRGRPLLLGIDLDQKVKEYIRLLRLSGGVVNRPIVLSVARGFVLNYKRSLLSEFGGSLALSKTWANSFLHRLGYVKRKGTKVARKLPDNFEEVKTKYLSRIVEYVHSCKIPPELIINWDQTGVSIVPTGDWTLEEKGSKQIDIIALDDKRQITAVFASTLSGELLPPQLLYQGKTPICHPDFKFPDEWDIFHSESHWSNESTMLRYVEKIVVPYCHLARQRLLLPLDQEAIVLFDVYKAHRSEALFKLLTENQIKFVFVPASCTSELQPLDAEGSVNAAFKTALKEEFSLWYSKEVATRLKQGGGSELLSNKISLSLSFLKPLHAKWFLNSFDKVSAQKSVIVAGWQKTDISKALNVEAPVQQINLDADEDEY